MTLPVAGQRTVTRPCTAVLAEDEPELAAELRETLARVWPELAIALLTLPCERAAGN